MIPISNFLSFLILLVIIIILTINYILHRKKSVLLLLFSFLLLIVTTITNIFEHVGRNTYFDQFEDLIEILFLPTLILSIQLTIIDKELAKRMISEKKFRAIFDQAFSFVGLLDKKGHLIDANQTALDFIDVEKEELIGKEFVDTPWWSHSEHERQKLLDAINKARNGELARFETSHPDSNNKLSFFDFTLKPLYNHLGELIYLIPEGRDITLLKSVQSELENHKKNLKQLVAEKTSDLSKAFIETQELNEKLLNNNEELNTVNEELFDQRKRLQDALNHLEELQEQLIESEKAAALGILTAGLAHEINNPLNFIMGGAEVLKNINKDGKSISSESIQQSLDAIFVGIERTSEIIKKLEVYNQVKSTITADVNIRVALENSIEKLKKDENKDIIVTTDYFPETLLIEADERAIDQIFLNILSNSFQAIEKEGEINISTKLINKKICLEIQDNGCGIEEAILPKVFDPFFTTHSPNQGTGMGLPIAKNFVSMYGGTINIISKQTEGTTVTITFPQKRDKHD